MNRAITILSFVILIGCAEPYSFEINSVTVEVIDAKVSTLQGRSYVRIYSLNGDEEVQQSGDLDVFIVDDSGVEYPFSYSIDSTYRPLSQGFRGEIGKAYKFIASREGEVLFESAYDAIYEPVDFELFTSDSSIMILNAGIFINKTGTAVYVTVPARSELYSKFEYRYFYEDYFTEDTVEVNDFEEYTLYSCLNNDCPDSTKLPVGLTLKDEWYFILADCVPPPEITNIIEQCPNVCCEYRENWPVLMEVISESITPEVYDYWLKVERLSENDGLVFDTYPFPLKVNIECVNCDHEVVGLFRAVAETSKKLEIML
ncbi:hypothetical protein [Ekhidna sp.]|uniref:hypothetical protein n=1 Tax=Ekhidna sp. TaxID=2608089 RepID=UPI003CCC2DD2